MSHPPAATCDSLLVEGTPCSGRGTPLNLSSTICLCVCDPGWSNRGDLTFLPASCDTNQHAVVALYVCVLAAALLPTGISSWHFFDILRRRFVRGNANVKLRTVLNAVHAAILLASLCWCVLSILIISGYSPEASSSMRFIGTDEVTTWLFFITGSTFFVASFLYLHLYTTLTLRQNKLGGRREDNAVLWKIYVIGLVCMTICVIADAFILAAYYHPLQSPELVIAFYVATGVGLGTLGVATPTVVSALLTDMKTVLDNDKAGREQQLREIGGLHSTKMRRMEELLVWLRRARFLATSSLLIVAILCVIWASIPVLRKVLIVYQMPVEFIVANLITGVLSRSITNFVRHSNASRKSRSASQDPRELKKLPDGVSPLTSNALVTPSTPAGGQEDDTRTNLSPGDDFPS